MKTLSKILKNQFSKRKLQVLLIDDIPPLGFEGEVVKVKPGYFKQYLLPNNIGIYNFPGIKENLYKNLDPKITEKKRNEFDYKILLENLHKRQVILREKSTYNPGILKKPLILNDFKEFLEKKFGLNLAAKQIKVDGNLNSFGLFILDLKEIKDESTGNVTDITMEIEVFDRSG